MEETTESPSQEKRLNTQLDQKQGKFLDESYPA